MYGVCIVVIKLIATFIILAHVTALIAQYLVSAWSSHGRVESNPWPVQQHDLLTHPERSQCVHCHCLLNETVRRVHELLAGNNASVVDEDVNVSNVFLHLVTNTHTHAWSFILCTLNNCTFSAFSLVNSNSNQLRYCVICSVLNLVTTIIIINITTWALYITPLFKSRSHLT